MPCISSGVASGSPGTAFYKSCIAGICATSAVPVAYGSGCSALQRLNTKAQCQWNNLSLSVCRGYSPLKRIGVVKSYPQTMQLHMIGSLRRERALLLAFKLQAQLRAASSSSNPSGDSENDSGGDCSGGSSVCKSSVVRGEFPGALRVLVMIGI